MMKNNVSTLLLSIGLLITAGNAHVEPVLLTDHVPAILTTDTGVTTKAEAKIVSPVVMEACTHLAHIIITGLHNAIEAGSTADGSFNYTTVCQFQATQSQTQQQEMSARLISLDLDPAEREQIILFGEFLIAQSALFFQNNTTLSLNLMQAPTKQAALAAIKSFDLFIRGLPERFATDFACAADTIQKPADDIVIAINEDDVDYSTAAFRKRVAALITQACDSSEAIIFDEIKNCTNKNGMFDGKLYMEHAGTLMQKMHECKKTVIDRAPQGDKYHVTMFLTQRHWQAAMQFRAQNPDFDSKVVAATTATEANELFTQFFKHCNQAKEQYLDEHFLNTEDANDNATDDESDTDSTDNAVTD